MKQTSVMSSCWLFLWPLSVLRCHGLMIVCVTLWMRGSQFQAIFLVGFARVVYSRNGPRSGAPRLKHTYGLLSLAIVTSSTAETAFGSGFTHDLRMRIREGKYSHSSFSLPNISRYSHHTTGSFLQVPFTGPYVLICALEEVHELSRRVNL